MAGGRVSLCQIAVTMVLTTRTPVPLLAMNPLTKCQGNLHSLCHIPFPESNALPLRHPTRSEKRAKMTVNQGLTRNDLCVISACKNWLYNIFQIVVQQKSLSDRPSAASVKKTTSYTGALLLHTTTDTVKNANQKKKKKKPEGAAFHMWWVSVRRSLNVLNQHLSKIDS